MRWLDAANSLLRVSWEGDRHLARRKLLLVGDSSTLCRHSFFVELLAYVKGVGGYRTAYECLS